MYMRYKFLVLASPSASSHASSAQEKPQTFTAQGISVEFTATHTVAGEEMKIQFKITDTNGSGVEQLAASCVDRSAPAKPNARRARLS